MLGSGVLFSVFPLLLVLHVCLLVSERLSIRHFVKEYPADLYLSPYLCSCALDPDWCAFHFIHIIIIVLICPTVHYGMVFLYQRI